jgi:hypothetical protein
MKIEDLEDWNLLDGIKTSEDLAYYIQTLSDEFDTLSDFYSEVMYIVERILKEK